MSQRYTYVWLWPQKCGTYSMLFIHYIDIIVHRTSLPPVMNHQIWEWEHGTVIIVNSNFERVNVFCCAHLWNLYVLCSLLAGKQGILPCLFILFYKSIESAIKWKQISKRLRWQRNYVQSAILSDDGHCKFV